MWVLEIFIINMLFVCVSICALLLKSIGGLRMSYFRLQLQDFCITWVIRKDLQIIWDDFAQIVPARYQKFIFLFKILLLSSQCGIQGSL